MKRFGNKVRWGINKKILKIHNAEVLKNTKQKVRSKEDKSNPKGGGYKFYLLIRRFEE